jgi:membrane-bound lytic murein transglycosylase D
MRGTLMYIVLWVFGFLIVPFCHSASAADADFPLYDTIGSNVAFWTKVYTQYSTRQAIVHDSLNLDIVYAVIDLLPYEAPSACRVNRKRMKNAKAKYESILRRLSADPTNDDSECRRVAALFDAHGVPKSFQNASRHVRCQIGQSDRFVAGLIRSGAYIDKIKAVFASYGLPVELAYLPHVESSFDPGAYSKFGAAGIWQFTRSTGQRFMKVSYVLDERRDPILATRAAAELLKENFEKLGSWPLAITAYNHGAAGMERAKKSYDDYPSIFDSYHSRTFKFASRNFYPEFLAAVDVAKNYQGYFGELALDRPCDFQTIELKGYTNFKALCNQLKVSTDLAQSLNPALRAPVFDGQKLVPKGYPFRFPSDVEMAEIPSNLFKENQKASHFYTVQRGDTAGKVARALKVDLADLILANNLNRRAVIYPNQTLRIPLRGEPVAARPEPQPEPAEPVLMAHNETPEAQIAAEAPSQAMPDAPLSGEPVAARPEPQPEPAEPVLMAHNETPEAQIAAEAPSQAMPDAPQTPVSVLPAAIATNMPDDRKPEATKEEGSPSNEIVSADVQFEKVINRPSCPTGIIKAEVEETLGHYAEWAGVRTQQIRRLNQLAFGQTLRLHQQIKIPLNKTTPQKFEENRYEFHKRLQEDFFAVYHISELQPYQVKRGDNLWNLCLEKFDIPMWLLKNCNPEVDFADLHIRQKLVVPLIEKSTDQPPDSLPSDDDGENDRMQVSMTSSKEAPI